MRSLRNQKTLIEQEIPPLRALYETQLFPPFATHFRRLCVICMRAWHKDLGSGRYFAANVRVRNGRELIAGCRPVSPIQHR